MITFFSRSSNKLFHKRNLSKIKAFTLGLSQEPTVIHHENKSV